MDELEALGLTDDAFALLHHFRLRGRRDTIASHRAYCAKHSSFQRDGDNERTQNRLKYVLRKHRKSAYPPSRSDIFVGLANDAFEKIPPHAVVKSVGLTALALSTQPNTSSERRLANRQVNYETNNVGAGSTLISDIPENLRCELASIWQKILRTKPTDLFMETMDRLEARLGLGDEIPQPGFVGSRYRPGGVLFLGKNPGKGSHLMSREDQLQFTAFERLRQAKLSDRESRFDDLMDLLARRVMPTWEVMKNYVLPILSTAQAGLDDVAYINLLKWRSEKTSSSLFDKSWKSHTRDQYMKLRPSLVIAVGKSTRDQFESLVRRFGPYRPERLHVLERSRRDSMRPPSSTIEKIPEVADEVLATLSALHSSSR